MLKVTVGIPCYNESKNILKCLDSITSQSDIFQDIEVLIVDDGSTDNTVKIIKNYIKKYLQTLGLSNNKGRFHPTPWSSAKN